MTTSSQSVTFHFQGEISVPAGEIYTFGYIPLPFDLPEGTNEIRLSLRYTPDRVDGVSNLVTLGLYDPEGIFRGNAHRSPPDEQVRVRADWASAGFIAGPLPAGTWLAQLAVQSVLASAPACAYSLDVELLAGESKPTAVKDFLPAPVVTLDRPGWYRGELHSHTLHSDAELTAAGLIEAAHRRGLDFLFITDHNTHSVYQELAAHATGHTPENLLLIPGIELTTFEGHALVLGIQEWIDWRSGHAGWSMQAAARQIQAQDGLFVVAHPLAVGSPWCTGCRWDYGGFDLAAANGIEVWNGFWGSEGDKNPEGLRLWHDLIKSGLNLIATAGTDIHSARDWEDGAPYVYVNARNLSGAGVLEALRAGRVILSSGPWVDLQIITKHEGVTAGVGETCRSEGPEITLSIEWQSVPGDGQLVIWNSQDVVEVVEVRGDGTHRLECALESNERFWVELYSSDGALLAMTNPVRVEIISSGQAAK